ncbi:MAG: cytochrome c [Bdellovibrionota bacterium]
MVKTLWLFLFPAICFAQSSPYVPSIENGKKLYEDNCTVCHGVQGDGKTAMATMLKKPPVSFLDPKIEESFTPQHAFDAMTEGRKDVGMQSFKNLSKKERWDLAAYVFTFRDQTLKVEDPRPELSWDESKLMSDSQIIELFRKRGLPEDKVIEQLTLIRSYPQ